MSANSRYLFAALCLTLLAFGSATLYQMGYEQAKFELGTIACWPTDDDPTPMETHP